MIVVTSNGNRMVLRQLLVMLQVQLQTVHSHHSPEYYHYDTSSGSYASYIDWAGVAVLQFALYTTVVAASCEDM